MARRTAIRSISLGSCGSAYDTDEIRSQRYHDTIGERRHATTSRIQ
ncbi:hypothetical protein NDS46_16515 [Paenibacillus thiaminolyticus]|nr:hypothetical protein [Paenibacillus thiaminolyticus]WCF05974.1 hypothetical protein NDS46_16515 [Paenibacillus thiaminolyticus]